MSAQLQEIIGTDGRRLRGQANRRKIIAAICALIREGSLTPTAEQVAARADVGLRSVFRHFDDMESVRLEVAMEFDRIVAPASRQRLKSRIWQERLRESVELRAALFENIMPFHLSSQISRHSSPGVEDRQQKAARLQRDLLYRVLPKTLADDPARFEAICAILSPHAWARLRRDQGLSVEAAKQVMLFAAEALTK